MSKEDAESMVRHGDLDGNGKLNETEFCIVIVRLSPGMMQDAGPGLTKQTNKSAANPQLNLIVIVIKLL